jgi:DNA polymerase-1
VSSKGKVILIDGNSLLYRAFFAMPHFSTLDNQPTNAVYGFTMMLLRLIQEEKPDIILVAFDAPAKTFRHEEFEAYKAHRKPPPDELISQQPIARRMVEAFNIPRLEVPGFEADDVIGTLAKMAENQDYDVVIVTGDLDALQLVDDKVRVMRTVKGVTETTIYDEQHVENEYGLQPRQFVDYKALVGDTSDNIPGVSGIGAKSAVKLLRQFDNLENLLRHAEEVEPARFRDILRGSRDVATLSKRLATIVKDVPLDVDLSKSRFTGPDYPRLRELFRELEFKTLLRRLPEETAQRSLFSESEIAPKVSKPSVVLNVIRSSAELNQLLDEVRATKEVVLRIDGSSPRGIDAEALGIAVGIPAGKVSYVRFGEETAIRFEDLRSVIEDDQVAKYGHNLKYEYEITARAGMELRGRTFDVMLAAYLLNPTRGTHSIESIALDYLGVELPTQAAKTGAIIGESTREEVLAPQVDGIAKLVPILQEKLTEDGLDALMSDVEMPLVPILAQMELIGVAVDGDWLQQLSRVLEERIAELEKEIYQLAGTDFNIGSPKQLQTILFDKLGLPSTKKTKTGFSTDADTLAALSPAHEIVAKILEYRELTKLKSTYADSLPKLMDRRTGHIHTSLNQAVTATGRLSSSEPNLQNIPIKTEIGRQIRKAFIASPGNVLISADYSQIELRILAHVSRDPELIRSFREDEDIHTRTATKIFDVPAEQVTSDMRRQAKTVNFAVIYGQTEHGLSRQLGIPREVAREYIAEYFKEYPGVRQYAADTLDRARLSGYVESLLGRRRYIAELNSSNRNFREFAERAAVNMPIQGTAADIVKIAMIQVVARLDERGFKTKIILQVHDELVFDAPESEVNSVVPVIKEAMESAFALDAPLKVEVKVGRDWCTALPISAEEAEDLSA